MKNFFKIPLFFLLLIGLLVSPSLFAGDKEKAVNYYHQRDYKNACIYMEKAAGQGDAEAQGMLGNFYSDGQGCKQDHRLAALWNRKAAEQGHPTAQYNLGL